MAVWLARHAQDLCAQERRLGDEGLSQLGRQQARALGERLAKVEFRGCLVSPMRRAGETARLVLEGRDVPLEVDPCLAEGALGALDGLSRAEAQRRHAADFRLGEGTVERIAASGRTAPGGESREIFLGRALAASQRVERELERGGELLMVSHGGLLNYMLQILLGVPVRDEVPFGFDHAHVVALRRAGRPGFGPFVSLWPVLQGVQGVDQGNQ